MMSETQTQTEQPEATQKSDVDTGAPVSFSLCDSACLVLLWFLIYMYTHYFLSYPFLSFSFGIVTHIHSNNGRSIKRTRLKSTRSKTTKPKRSRCARLLDRTCEPFIAPGGASLWPFLSGSRSPRFCLKSGSRWIWRKKRSGPPTLPMSPGRSPCALF